MKINNTEDLNKMNEVLRKEFKKQGLTKEEIDVLIEQLEAVAQLKESGFL